MSTPRRWDAIDLGIRFLKNRELVAEAAEAEKQLALLIDDFEMTDALQKECLEQARLNGMGSEREARLLAVVEEQKREIAKLTKDRDVWKATAEDLLNIARNLRTFRDGSVAHTSAANYLTKIIESPLFEGSGNA